MITEVDRYAEICVQAHNLAEEEAKNMLETELQLDSLDNSKKNAEQTLMTTDTQLHGTVQTYLDELSQVLNLVNKCKDDSEELQNRFIHMKNNCEETLKTLKDSDVINKINLIQNNYLSVASQLSFLNSMTNALQNLHDKITKDYRNLRVVYDEWIKYLSWKTHMMTEIKSLGTDEKRNRARHVFNPFFELIDQVGNEIHDKLWEHVNRSIELAQYDPASLVRALIIIERADRRRQKSIENREKKLPYQSWMIDYLDYKKELYAHLKAAIQRRCNNAYNKGTQLTEKLKIGMQLLSDLEIVRSKVVPCYPEDYDILNFYVHEYALVSQAQLETIYNNADLEPSSILSLIEWLESYNEEIISWGCKEISEFNSAKGRLMGKFTVVVKTKLTEWIQRLIDRRDVPSLTDSGSYATALPEDIYNLIKMQMQIATEHLKDKTLYLSIKVCVDCLSTYTDYIENKMKTEGELLEPEQLCTMINNTKRLSDLIEGIPDIIEENFDVNSLNELKDYISKQSEKYLDLCTELALLLAHNIWLDIEASQIMKTSIFNDEWLEEENCQAMLTVLSTFEDYFDDLKHWISSKLFLGHTIKTCLETVVKNYVEYMCKANYVPDEIIMVGSRIRRDYDEILGYFTNPDFLSCMKYVKREFRVEEGVAQVLAPLRNLEIYFKLNEFNLVEDGKLTQEGFTYISEILSSRLLPNGIHSLIKLRNDLSSEAVALIEGQFAFFK